MMDSWTIPLLVLESFSVSISRDLGLDSSKLRDRFFCDSVGDRLELRLSAGIMMGSDRISCIKLCAVLIPGQ